MPLGPRSTRHSPRRISRLKSLKTILAPKMQRDTLELHQTTAALLIHEYRTSAHYTPEVRVAHHSLRQRWASPCMAGRGQNQAGRSAQPAARSPRRRGFRLSALYPLRRDRPGPHRQAQKRNRRKSSATPLDILRSRSRRTYPGSAGGL